MRVGADIGGATSSFPALSVRSSFRRARPAPVNASPNPSPMITRLDCTQRNAAGLVAAGRAVPSAEFRGDAHDTVMRMQGTMRVTTQVGKQFRDVESRHIPGAGPAAGAHAR